MFIQLCVYLFNEHTLAKHTDALNEHAGWYTLMYKTINKHRALFISRSHLLCKLTWDVELPPSSSPGVLSAGVP